MKNETLLNALDKAREDESYCMGMAGAWSVGSPARTRLWEQHQRRIRQMKKFRIAILARMERK